MGSSTKKCKSRSKIELFFENVKTLSYFIQTLLRSSMTFPWLAEKVEIHLKIQIHLLILIH